MTIPSVLAAVIHCGRETTLTVLALLHREIFDRNAGVFVHAQRDDFLLQAARLPHHKGLQVRKEDQSVKCGAAYLILSDAKSLLKVN